MPWPRVRVVRWRRPLPRWPALAAAGALAGGFMAGAAAAYALAPSERAALAAAVAAYVRSRAHGRGDVLGPALRGWLQAAGPVWIAGMVRTVGVPLALAALALHAFALGMGLSVAAAGGGASGLAAGALAILPGNLLALPALGWLGGRAVALAARPAPGPLPASYVRLGAAVLVGVTLSSVGEAELAPLLLRAFHVGG